MTKKEGIPIKDWLVKIERDQNLNEIAELVLNTYSGRRRWFHTRKIENQIKIGFYDPNSEKIVIGPNDGRHIVTGTQVAVASAADSTLTVPAGYKYKLIYAAITNDTRGPSATLTITPHGYDPFVVDTGTGVGLANQSLALLGGSAWDPAALGALPSMNGPVWLSAGSTAVLNNTNFVAADVMRHEFVFEIYALV